MSYLIAGILLMVTGFGIKWYIDKLRFDRFLSELQGEKRAKRIKAKRKEFERHTEAIRRKRIEYDKAINDYQSKYNTNLNDSKD